MSMIRPGAYESVYTHILRLFAQKKITWTATGDDVLNYYGAPKFVTGLQVCVAKDNLDRARDAFQDDSTWCKQSAPAVDSYQDVFKEYPRFKLCNDDLFITVVPATLYGLNPLNTKKFIQPHPSDSCPMLHLKYHVEGIAEHVSKNANDPNITWWKMRLEFLIDGMDIDKDWCEKHLKDGPGRELVLSKSTPAAKINRIGKRKYMDGMLTCYVDKDNRAEVIKTMGRN
ncbi:hypothetical protein BD410DRAFT_788571 [Rickenella mellea]|uniref:Uncharacterized protein n=1 Tax=Rickenella mellea TaxID=50990 RepID=A0A4Y7Q3T7_9AGAM|nr:hypothetical protein BD410DRAFT_788571 [Rickenella mellea]